MLFFFFQAEDGIRDKLVTGVQTCALPISGSAAILVLLVAAAPTCTAQLTYFLAFAAGTMLGMLFVSFSLAGLVRLASGRGARWATVLHLGSATVSVVVGLLLAARVVGEL